MPEDAIQYLFSGIVLGLSAGLSPGPLTALVLRESLSRSAAAGIRAACAPFATDLPIVAGSVFLLRELASFGLVLGFISLAGAGFLVRLGWESVRSATPTADGGAAAGTWWQGILVNFLSPHPYLSWITVGAPLLVQAAADGLAGPTLFLAGFYACLVGAKVVLAIAAARFRTAIGGRAYALIMKALGVALWALAILFLIEAIGYIRAES